MIQFSEWAAASASGRAPGAGGSILRFRCAGHIPEKENIVHDIDMHTAGFHIVVGPALLVECFQLTLQDQNHNQADYDSDDQRNYQTFTCIERITIDVSIKLVGTFIDEFIECPGVIPVRQITYDIVADGIDITGINRYTGIAVTEDPVFPDIHTEQQ